MRNSWSISYLTKDYEAFRAYFLESVGELQGSGVWALVVSLNLPWPSKFTKILIILRLDSMESCRSFETFNLEASLKKNLVYFFLITRSTFSCCLWGSAVPLFCSLMPNVKLLRFWSEIIKRILGETHVFGRTFIFCAFLCYGGALGLLRNVVDLSVSVNMSRPAETK